MKIILRFKSYFLRKRQSYFLKKFNKYRTLSKNEQTFSFLIDPINFQHNEFVYSELLEKYRSKIVCLSSKISMVEKLL